MSFTQDELQAFNSILEQKLAIQRRELERTFDQRLQVLRREFERRLSAAQQEILHDLPRRLSEQEYKLKDALLHKLDSQQARMTQALAQEIEQRQQPFEESIEHALAAQLLAFEQLMNQRFPSAPTEATSYTDETAHTGFGAIEVQTELPWDELTDVINTALSERLSSLKESVQISIKNMEHYLAAQLHALRDDLARTSSRPYSGGMADIQEVFTSISQLEHVIESMQVAMTSNMALLSNRLYHHQQLPLERAHPANSTAPSPQQSSNGTTRQLPHINDHESEQ